MNDAKLKAKIVENRLNGQTVASFLNISTAALWRKMTGKNEFTLSEIKKLASVLCLDDKEMKEIFFADFVAETEQKEVQ